MFKDFTIYQGHTPNDVASTNFGGIVYRFRGNYPNIPDSELKNWLLTTSARDFIYTKNYTLTEAINQAKQYNMNLIVNMNEVIREDIPLVGLDLFGRVAGILADILIENGLKDRSAIALINEPAERWKMIEMLYVQYCYKANTYVKGRIPLILSNEEYHRWDEKIIFEQTVNIPNRIFGVHHLSSFGSAPRWQNIIDAKTQANAWKIPIICNEGGSWFKDYQKSEGHNINLKLLEECYKYGYLGFSICVPVLNEAGRQVFKILGYLIYNNDYSKLLAQNNWGEFINEIKEYKKEEIIMYKRPEQLQLFYDEVGWVRPYNENLPNLPIVGKKNPSQNITWADLDAVMESLIKAMFADKNYPNIKYDDNGNWVSNWLTYAKSGGEI